MSDTELFSLKLSGTGLSVDQKISKELATRIMLLVFGDGKTETPAPRENTPESTTGMRKSAKPVNGVSLREYLNQHEAKKIPQQIVAIGSYRESSSGKDHFTRDELLSGFRDAKVPAPGNPPRDIARTIELGWIAPAGTEKDQYYVTGTGQSAIESNFAEKIAGGRAGRRRGKRGKKAAKKAAKVATK